MIPARAIPIYQKALALDPKHRGAHEYIGEATLMLGDVGSARQRRARLDTLCFFGCSEYRDLQQAVEAFERQATSGSKCRIARAAGGDRLAAGRGRFVDDVRVDGMLHAAVLRSPHAHARLLSVDATRARELPGVRVVLTATEVPEAAVILLASGDIQNFVIG